MKHPARVVGAFVVAMIIFGFLSPGLWRSGPGLAGYAAGDVRKLDSRNKQVWLTHEEIPSLSLPPGTTLFDVRDTAGLDKVQPQDHVIFKSVVERGKLVITEIRPQR